MCVRVCVCMCVCVYWHSNVLKIYKTSKKELLDITNEFLNHSPFFKPQLPILNLAMYKKQHCWTFIMFLCNILSEFENFLLQKDVMHKVPRSIHNY